MHGAHPARRFGLNVGCRLRPRASPHRFMTYFSRFGNYSNLAAGKDFSGDR